MRASPSRAASAFWNEAAAAHNLLGQVRAVLVGNSFPGVFRAYLARRYGMRVEKPAHALPVKTNFCIPVWR